MVILFSNFIFIKWLYFVTYFNQLSFQVLLGKNVRILSKDNVNMAFS